MDESQQYGNYHEIAALAAIQQPALLVFVGEHRQTPGGLSKGRAAAANRQKLLHRPLGLRALNRPGDYLPPARLPKLIALAGCKPGQRFGSGAATQPRPSTAYRDLGNGDNCPTVTNLLGAPFQ